MVLLKEEHELVLLEFIKSNPYLHLFYHGDYLAYGFDHPDCNFYGEFEDGVLSCCIMRYKDSIHIGGTSISPEGLKFMYELFEQKKCEMIHCSEMFISQLLDSPISFKVDISSLSVYDKYYFSLTENDVEILGMKDVDEYIKILDQEFNINTNRDEFIDDHLQGRNISYCFKLDGKIVSIASVTARTPSAAMIIGVATLKDYRNKGYASRCVQYLCNDLMKDDVATVLFYTDVGAGKIYHRTGFVDQEKYYLLKRIGVIG